MNHVLTNQQEQIRLSREQSKSWDSRSRPD